MLVLGLNAYHGDSAACLVRDGTLLGAAEEERFRRIKHWAGLPTQAIAWCLNEASAKLSDVDAVAINRKPGVNNLRRLGFVLAHWPDPRLMFNRLRNIRSATSFADALQAAFPNDRLRATVHHVEHHLAHLASAYLVSPFEEAVCLSVDGFGDFASAAWGMGRAGDIQIDGRVYFPHSLGIFYSAITQLIGFPHYGDEYKVMGLAPYGEPRFLEPMRQIVRVNSDGTFRLDLRFFRHHTANVSYSWKDCAPEVGTLCTPALEELLGPTRKKDQPLDQKHKDLARSAQAMYEEAFFTLLNALYEKYRCPNLALSGGCAMNSVANGKVYLKSPFKRMYLPAAAGDAGGAIGAAFAVWHQVGRAESGEQRAEDGGNRNDRRRTPDSQPSTLNSQLGLATPAFSLQPSAFRTNGRFVMNHAYTGPAFNEEVIESLLCARGLLEKQSASPLRLDPHPRSQERESPLAHRMGEGGPQGRVRAIEDRVRDVGEQPTHMREGQGEVSNTTMKCSSTALVSGDPCVSVSIRGSTSEFSVTRYTNASELCTRTAQAISEGQVVGWFQGRMEWGPRALGNRSILGDPRRADMKDILNAKIKRRESFRPFAPSILREQVNEWFEQDDDVPFMMQVFQIRADKRALVPAICHVDGSGRLQTVHQETNPLYHQLISAFCSLTSVPMILNTSFNENEPVVCRPEEALDCFLRTKMDVLVLGCHFVARRELGAGREGAMSGEQGA